MDIDILARQLKMERLRRGWTLQQASDLTRISITMLKMLEQKNFKRIGGQHTVEMLLRSYSNAFGQEGPCPGSAPADRLQTDGRGPDGRKPQSGPYLRPLLAAGLIIAVIAGLGLVYYEYGTRLISFGKPTPEARIENRTGEPKIEQNAVVPGNTEKNTASPGEQPLAVGPTGPDNRPDQPKTEENPLGVSIEEGHASTPGEQSRAAGAVREQMEPSGKENTGRDEQPGLPSASEDAVNKPQEQSGTEVAPGSAPACAPSIGAAHQLEMEAAQKTWIQVTIDGIKPQSELLQPGERRKWKVLKKADLVIGNRGGVELKWDGRPVDLGGSTARVIRLSLTDSGIVLK
ncbi:MAG TPA: RodZ domain-containing protein [Syntrophobacteraceae bacterium]|nr:RodZ domain-containing protein [Syntrophobacteraceae bacterium]